MTVSEPGLKCDSVWDPLLSYFENQNTLLPNVFVLVTANVDIITYFLCMHIAFYQSQSLKGLHRPALNHASLKACVGKEESSTKIWSG